MIDETLYDVLENHCLRHLGKIKKPCELHLDIHFPEPHFRCLIERSQAILACFHQKGCFSKILKCNESRNFLNALSEFIRLTIDSTPVQLLLLSIRDDVDFSRALNLFESSFSDNLIEPLFDVCKDERYRKSLDVKKVLTILIDNKTKSGIFCIRLLDLLFNIDVEAYYSICVTSLLSYFDNTATKICINNFILNKLQCQFALEDQISSFGLIEHPEILLDVIFFLCQNGVALAISRSDFVQKFISETFNNTLFSFEMRSKALEIKLMVSPETLDWSNCIKTFHTPQLLVKYAKVLLNKIDINMLRDAFSAVPFTFFCSLEFLDIFHSQFALNCITIQPVGVDALDGLLRNSELSEGLRVFTLLAFCFGKTHIYSTANIQVSQIVFLLSLLDKTSNYKRELSFIIAISLGTFLADSLNPLVFSNALKTVKRSHNFWQVKLDELLMQSGLDSVFDLLKPLLEQDDVPAYIIFMKQLFILCGHLPYKKLQTQICFDVNTKSLSANLQFVKNELIAPINLDLTNLLSYSKELHERFVHTTTTLHQGYAIESKDDFKNVLQNLIVLTDELNYLMKHWKKQSSDNSSLNEADLDLRCVQLAELSCCVEIVLKILLFLCTFFQKLAQSECSDDSETTAICSEFIDCLCAVWHFMFPMLRHDARQLWFEIVFSKSIYILAKLLTRVCLIWKHSSVLMIKMHFCRCLSTFLTIIKNSSNERLISLLLKRNISQINITSDFVRKEVQYIICTHKYAKVDSETGTIALYIDKMCNQLIKSSGKLKSMVPNHISKFHHRNRTTEQQLCI